MNKNLKLALAALCVAGSAYASKSNNKTSLYVRMSRDIVPAYTTFNEMLTQYSDEKIGGHLQATMFYGRSVNGSHLAKSFGADGATTLVIAVLTAPSRWPVHSGLLLHNRLSADTISGTVKFDPKQTVFGTRFDYVQRFDKWLDGLFFCANLPIVHINNDINMTVLDGVKGLNSGTTHEGISIENLVFGDPILRTLNAAENAQHKLMNGKLTENDRTGLGDLEARIGWRFLESDTYHASINATGIAPTSKSTDGKHLWEVKTGDEKWAIGMGTDGSIMLWSEEDQNLKVYADLQYKYLFSKNEKRTLKIKELRYQVLGAPRVLNDVIWSQYYLIGTNGVAGLQPLANVSTLDVSVHTGSHVYGTMAFRYNQGGLTLDAGYNGYWKEAESVKYNGAWHDDKYGVAGYDYDASTIFEEAELLANTARGWIKKTDLDLDAAATPATWTHKFFAGLGYTAFNWDYPVMVGTGIAYEFPSSNRDAAEGYSFWGKIGVAF